MDPVARAKVVLDQWPDVRLAVLFGSRARGRVRRDSDIDLGVSITAGAEIDRALEVALQRATGRPVGLTLMDAAPPLLRFEMSRDGVVLVEREPGMWARFRAQAMIDWWDWAPTARIVQRTMAARLREEAARGPA